MSDIVRLDSIHHSHNERLKRFCGQTGTVVTKDARGYCLVRFGDNPFNQYWVHPRFLIREKKHD